jgi:hypothetical protein
MARTIKKSIKCLYEKSPGKLQFFSDSSFIWSSDVTSKIDAPQGYIADVENRKLSKAQPGKPLYLQISLRQPNKATFNFQFDTVEQRQDVYETFSSTNQAPQPRSATSSPVSMPMASSNHDETTKPQVTKQFKFDFSNIEPSTFHHQPSQQSAQPISDEEKRARESLLQKDRVLESQYKKLVLENHLLSDEDFWVGKESRLEEEKLQFKLKQGLKPESLVDPQQQLASKRSATSQEIEMTMTKEMMQRVFLEHPEVLQKYKDNVPQNLSEKEFWTAYMHCKYVLGSKRNIEFQDLKNLNFQATKDKLKHNQRTKEQEQIAEKLFGSVDDYRLQYRDELDGKFAKRIKYVDEDVDLRKTLDDSIGYSVIPGLQSTSESGGYGIVQRDPSDGLVAKSELEFARSLREKAKVVDKDTAKRITKAVKDDPLLTKINERATLALHTYGAREEHRSEELRKTRLKEDFQQELNLDGDLLPDPKPIVYSLTLPQQQTPSFHTTTNPPSGNGFRPIHNGAEEFNPSRSLPTKDYCYSPFQPQEEEAVLLKIDPMLQGDNVPSDIRDGFLVAIGAVDEYCRHFWSSTISDSSDMKKRCAIVKKMKELEKQMNGELRQAMRLKAAELTQLLKLPLAQLSCCYEEHSKKCDLNHGR